MELVYDCPDPDGFKLSMSNDIESGRTEVTITMSIEPAQYWTATALMDKPRDEPVRIVLNIPG